MTRLDINENQQADNPTEVVKLQQEVDKLKKSLKRKENKKIFSCFNCLGITIVFLIVLLVFGAYLLAQSGLAEVPFFSDKFYEEPVPTYLVKNSEAATELKDPFGALPGIIKQKITNLPVNSEKNIDLVITDSQLTAQVQKLVQENPEVAAQIDSCQVAVLSDSLELFIKRKAPFKGIITLNLVPTIKNDKLNLTFTNFQIGSLHLPKWLANFFLGWVAEQGLNTLWQNLQQYGRVNEIQLQKGYLQLKLFIK